MLEEVILLGLLTAALASLYVTRRRLTQTRAVLDDAEYKLRVAGSVNDALVDRAEDAKYATARAENVAASYRQRAEIAEIRVENLEAEARSTRELQARRVAEKFEANLRDAKAAKAEEPEDGPYTRARKWIEDHPKGFFSTKALRKATDTSHKQVGAALQEAKAKGLVVNEDRGMWARTSKKAKS